MGKIHAVLGMAMAMGAVMEVNREQEKERILREWDESRKLPRKKKKKRRKELLLDWQLAHWKIEL